jgi:hypothetical protein
VRCDWEKKRGWPRTLGRGWRSGQCSYAIRRPSAWHIVVKRCIQRCTTTKGKSVEDGEGNKGRGAPRRRSKSGSSRSTRIHGLKAKGTQEEQTLRRRVGQLGWIARLRHGRKKKKRAHAASRQSSQPFAIHFPQPHSAASAVLGDGIPLHGPASTRNPPEHPRRDRSHYTEKYRGARCGGGSSPP